MESLWHSTAQHGTVPPLLPTPTLTFSVTYWHRLRSWSPSGRISGSTMGTMPFCNHYANAMIGMSMDIPMGTNDRTQGGMLSPQAQCPPLLVMPSLGGSFFGSTEQCLCLWYHEAMPVPMNPCRIPWVMPTPWGNAWFWGSMHIHV